MNLIDQIESGQASRPRRVLLYGPRGIGLTTFAAALPSPVFVTVDDSVAHLDCPRFPIARRFGGVMAALQELYVQPHDYRVVVIDPLDTLERLVIDELCRERGIEHVDDILFAKGYTLALTVWRQLLGRLDLLRNDIGLHCVLVARAQFERRGEAIGGGNAVALTERSVPMLDRQASALLQGWCDEIFFASHADRSVPAGGGAKASRIIHTQPSATHVAKNRLGLPPQVPMEAASLAPCLSMPSAAAAQSPGSESRGTSRGRR
jgi:hypothetical protein